MSFYEYDTFCVPLTPNSLHTLSVEECTNGYRVEGIYPSFWLSVGLDKFTREREGESVCLCM